MLLILQLARIVSTSELRISFTSKGLGCLRFGSNLPSRKQSQILSGLTPVFTEHWRQSVMVIVIIILLIYNTTIINKLSDTSLISSDSCKLF